MVDKGLFVVGIGASAGGLQPLFELFSNISEKPEVAFVVVQHLSRHYKSQMKSILSKYTSLPIISITNGLTINVNTIYLMPENTHVYMKAHQLFLKQREENEIVNYAIDDFFISMARDIKKNAIGILLSGMGNDGTKGAIAIEDAGGIVMVQDPKSSEYDGMTNSAIYNDHPDYILYPKQMGKYLTEYIQNKNF